MSGTGLIRDKWNMIYGKGLQKKRIDLYTQWQYRHNIRVIRKTLREIAEEGKLDDERKLFM